MDCMKECILSIFWPKKDIVEFMKNIGCTSRDLMPENEYRELHRAEILLWRIKVNVFVVI